MLKHALLLRDGTRCIGPGFDHEGVLDCSHIFPKSVYSHIRFDLDNVMVQCRKHHEWWGKNSKIAGDWIQTVIPKDRYDRLLAKAIASLQDTLPLDLPAWERYLKQAIQQYAKRRSSYF
jgi:hypothetical protein